MNRFMLDFGIMEGVFNAPVEFFEQYGEVRVAKDGRKHIFIDNGSDVLAVAHLDYVCKLDHFYRLMIDKKEVVLSPRADDRLGAYLLLSILPQLGITPDILLTIDEETGKSTGGDFETTKDYNWMFEFDRRGDDVVTYMYKGAEWTAEIAKHFKPGTGSCSDISKMEHLLCQGMNVGCGYHDEHQTFCYTVIDELVSQVTKFEGFWAENKDKRYAYEKSKTPAYTGYSYYQPYRGQYTWDAEWGEQPALPAGKTVSVAPPRKYGQATQAYVYDVCIHCYKRLYVASQYHHTCEGEVVCLECVSKLGLKECAQCHIYDRLEEVVGRDGATEEWCSECLELMDASVIESCLDGHEYVGKEMPTECKFCHIPLQGERHELFLGICSSCGDHAEECDECGNYILTTCQECEEKHVPIIVTETD